jgi:hypothetical protein
MVELHSNTALEGTTRKDQGVLQRTAPPREARDHARRTSWFETGFCVHEHPTDGGLMWIGDHIRPRIRAPESWAPPVQPDVQLGVVHPYRFRGPPRSK